MSAMDHPAIAEAEIGLRLPVGATLGEVETTFGERVEVGTHQDTDHGMPLVGTVDLWMQHDGSTTAFLDAKALRGLAALCLAAAEVLDPTPPMRDCVDCGASCGTPSDEWGAPLCGNCQNARSGGWGA